MEITAHFNLMRDSVHKARGRMGELGQPFVRRLKAVAEVDTGSPRCLKDGEIFGIDLLQPEVSGCRRAAARISASMLKSGDDARLSGPNATVAPAESIFSKGYGAWPK